MTVGAVLSLASLSGMSGTSAVIAAGSDKQDVSITILGAGDKPVSSAVVALYPDDPSIAAAGNEDIAKMVQYQKQFHPYVLPVHLGTEVFFPNRDDFRHHVYSFSKTKTFESSLYGGDTEVSFVFDKAGIVPLGCNIHDQMIAFIYVTDSRIFEVTGADGVATFDTLPTGTYRITVWHPALAEPVEVANGYDLAESHKNHSFRVEIDPGDR